jgi:dipeptidyl aminopeptidase/acylaminoacyl peptidase
MGYVDPKRIGVHGHSYGGEGAAFIGTRSTLFAAVGMGAGVTDLTSDFSQSWGWSYQVSGGSGTNGNNYYMLGQGRWGFSPWENPERYRFESALTHAPRAAAPFLIMHGTADPTVSFTEGMNFYNALRFNGKDAVMLAYPGEGHGLRGSGQPQGPHHPVLPVLRSLPAWCRSARVDDRWRAVHRQGRTARPEMTVRVISRCR